MPRNGHGDADEKLKSLCDQEKFCQSFANIPKIKTTARRLKQDCSSVIKEFNGMYFQHYVDLVTELGTNHRLYRHWYMSYGTRRSETDSL